MVNYLFNPPDAMLACLLVVDASSEINLPTSFGILYLDYLVGLLSKPFIKDPNIGQYFDLACISVVTFDVVYYLVKMSYFPSS